MVAITDLAESRRNFERAVATEVKSRNELDTALESLNEITGKRYYNLAALGDNFPLMPPQPADIEQWVKTAERQNFDLMATNYNVIYQRENIKVKQAGHFPTLTASGGYNYNYETNPSYLATDQYGRSRSASAGLELNIPIFNGGSVTAASRQADYQYQGALGDLERKHREIVSSTRQAYLGVITSISAIKADLEAIKAAESALKSVLANYTVGRRTMTGVLDAQSKLYEAQTAYAQDQNSYILFLLQLKIATGSLVVNDLKDINSWLERSDSTAKPKQRSMVARKKQNKIITRTKSTKKRVKAAKPTSDSVNKIKVLKVGSVEPL
jgi:outer membrane protein